ncbi:hypothetical protein, conserved [Trypanosoma brucei gambiense DAL972]|uniref:Uncharacterized protein n=1 Tax=Trypanosoma brucei gambiense (strain MHOM/CI/86/DAL972) TaxID=679716 RepID=C9ZVJ1_TRYB9|nr:hypothetical protein, conserved [Trypanosoma brucei gambiense DAL972]CBH13429.1 hypothetical protein, conserved [Trypanosoma brucei gambiense DAL972]|eukprot:XP_011775706.1 hypothetical protein, conserved [Trypanosoma brucei gambiense DAL972]
MPPKQHKEKKKKKKKSTPEDDLDEPYHRWLDETYYIARTHREHAAAVHMEFISTAIKACTTAIVPYNEMLLLTTGMPTCETEVVPMVSVPSIIRSLGFNPTTKQLMQIGWITALVKEPPAEFLSDVLSRTLWESENENKLKRCMLMTHIDFESCDLLTSRKKLENVGLQLLQTGSFVFDPSQVPRVFLPAVDLLRRVPVVVQRSDADTLDKVFETIWAAANTCERGTGGIRQMNIAALHKTLTTAMRSHRKTSETMEEPSLTKVEMESLLSFVCGEGGNVDEDTFALTAV